MKQTSMIGASELTLANAISLNRLSLKARVLTKDALDNIVEVDELQDILSSTYVSIPQLNTRLDKLWSDILTLVSGSGSGGTVVTGLDVNEVMDYFGRISVLKPHNDDGKAVHLKIEFYRDEALSKPINILNTFSTSNANARNVVYAYIGGNSEETAWLPMTNHRIQNGLGPEFDNYPVMIDLTKWLEYKGTTAKDVLSIDKKMFLKYVWFWIDEQGNEHKSDEFALVFPSIVEVGANAGGGRSGSSGNASLLSTKLDQIALFPQFDPMKHYDVGDLATYNGKLLSANEEVDFKDFNESQWSETSISAVLDNTIPNDIMTKKDLSSIDVNVKLTDGSELSIIGGNYIQTTDDVDMYGGKNAFIQANTYKETYGKSSVGSKGFYVLSVIGNNKLKLSGSISIPTSAYSKVWSVSLDNKLNSQFSTISSINGQIVTFNSPFDSTIQAMSISSESQLSALIAGNDNAFYCPSDASIGNVILNFYGQHAEGGSVHAIAQYSHAEGRATTAEGRYSHAEGGNGTTAGGVAAHAEGFGAKALGNSSHAEGSQTFATGMYAHVEGFYSKSLGDVAHAEGQGTSAKGTASHAEGISSYTTGIASHAEGFKTFATGRYAHAEGEQTQAVTDNAHAAGFMSYAGGWNSTAIGRYSKVKDADHNAFVWQGIADNVYYESKGVGTFCINPKDGLNGFYIGLSSLGQILQNSHDYTSFEVFPTDKVIPAGTTDSLDGLSALFNWNNEDIQDMSNCIFTDLQYSIDVPIGLSVKLLVISTINEGDEINIDWGDGIIEQLPIAESQYATHTYAKARKYVVKVYGNGIYQLRETNGLISRFMDNQLQFSQNLKNISSFTAGSLRLLKIDIPYEFNLKSISNIYGLFADCMNLKQFILAGNENLYEKGVFNKKFQSFGRLFKNCENLEVDISHLNSIFANWSEDSEFAECFLNCAKLTGTVNPKLFWNSFHASRYIAGKEYNIYENCFAGCSVDIRNQVPLSWGGLSLMAVPEKSIEATLEIKDAQTEADSTFTLKFGKAKYTGITVIWGDNTGTYQKPIDGTITISHNYQMNGTYNIKIFGVQLLTSFLFNADNSKRIITKVDFIQPLSISSSYRIMPNIGVQSLDLSNVNWKKAGSYSLGGCNKLESIELPNQLEELGTEMLAWCSKLTSIVIPESVQTIASNVFKSCALLTDVKFNGKTEDEIKSMTNYDKWFSNGSTPPSQNITIWWNKLVDGTMTYGSFAYN